MGSGFGASGDRVRSYSQKSAEARAGTNLSIPESNDGVELAHLGAISLSVGSSSLVKAKRTRHTDRIGHHGGHLQFSERPHRVKSALMK